MLELESFDNSEPDGRTLETTGVVRKANKVKDQGEI